MYLKNIEIQGFKSFANKIRLDFHSGITGIVGPNGSGKSNVADAVRWVLGEQSAKQLRGGAMQDVIFSGTENRKPLGFAFVAITLDNSDRSLSLDADEVTVSRRLYRSGESEYMLNGVKCRLRDVNELFYDTGIGKEGYSIIGQGQIDRILSGKPEERRELFDEAAGIVKFKRRKIETLKKLDNEQANLVRVHDILAELEAQLKPLEDQSAKAAEYLEKKEQLQQADLQLFLHDTESFDNQREGLEKQKDQSLKEQAEIETNFARTRTEYERVEDQMGELETRISDTQQDSRQAELNKQEAEGKINVLKEQIAASDSNIRILNERLNSIRAEKEERTASRGFNQSELEKIEADYKDAGKRLDAVDLAYAELREELEKHEGMAEKSKQENITLLNARSAIRENLQRYDTMLEQTDIRRKDLSGRRDQAAADKSEQQAAYENLKAESEENDRLINEKKAEMFDVQKETKSLMDEEAAAVKESEELRNEYHRLNSRLESLIQIAEHYEGYGNSIRRVMEQKEKVPGIHGVVADLIRTDKKYETAIETALGSSLQNIITDDENTAKRMIAFLKTNKFGRATFLPLTAMRNGQTLSNDSVLHERGAIGRADTLVKTENIYRPIIERLLGRTVIIDNIDSAIRIGRRYNQSVRMVTLEGEVINPGGAMTGGSFKNNTNLLGRKREITELSDKTELAKSEAEQAEDKLKKIREKGIRMTDRLNGLSGELQELYLQQNSTSLNLENLEKAIGDLDTGLSAMDRELEELEGQMKDIRGRREEISKNLDVSKNEEADLERRIRALSEGTEELRKKQEAIRREQDEAKLAYSAAVQKREFVQEKIRTSDTEMKRLEEEESGLAAQSEKEEASKDEKKASIAEIEKTIRDYQSILRDCSRAIEDYSKQKEELNNAHKDFFNQRDRLSQKKTELEQELFKINAGIERLDEKQDARVNYLYEEYQITPDMVEGLIDRQEAQEPAELRKTIGTLKGAIHRLGDVNVGAIEQYKEVKGRYDFLYAQHSDLVKSAEDLKTIIKDLDDGMKKQFKEKFEAIRQEFNVVFRELFGGGRGELELVDQENILETGISIISQPPGKKLQNMMQLSGGEKALTAIALLFAIQNLKPSPFCLLDEIEAALDDNNVTRYARYLHKLTKNTQFIIITHRRGTMTAADRLYGITMQEKGVSTLVSVDLIENQLDK
ncbi:MAG: chromosome segregation protein SMC [Eubacterium sp.]|nr:chromosome segregation protein SMC [Eubacterium sp.]